MPHHSGFYCKENAMFVYISSHLFIYLFIYSMGTLTTVRAVVVVDVILAS